MTYKNSKSGVYKVTNTINNKFYIGSSVNTSNRWTSWKSTFRKDTLEYECLLWKAVKKYGLENFTFEVIEECETIREVLEEREQYYLDTLNPEYNIAKNAYRAQLGLDPWNKGTVGLQEAWNKGLKLSEEHKQKLIEANLGKEPWNKGIPCSDETKQKISEALTVQEAWNKGVPMSDEQKQQMSERMKENLNLDHLQKMTEAARLVNTGKERSEETKQKISESNLNSDARKAFAESRKGVERTDDVKEKISEGLRTSEKAAEHHLSRIGKSTNKSTHGQYGITWRNDSNKWIVKIHNKKYGSFKTIEEAIVRRDEIMVQLSAK